MLKASVDESNAHTLSRLLLPAECAKGNTAARIAVEGGAPSIQLTVTKGAVTDTEAIARKEKGRTVISCCLLLICSTCRLLLVPSPSSSSSRPFPASPRPSSTTLPISTTTVFLELARNLSWEVRIRMILRSVPSQFDLQAALLRPENPHPSRRSPRVLPHNRPRGRRRRVEVRVRSSLDGFLQDLVVAFPSLTSLDLLFAPAIGFAAGAAFYFSSLRRGKPSDVDAVVGDWVLFTSPTPFNRSVLLRCPSVSFEDGGELLEGVNESLLRDERHYVNLSRGRIPFAREEGDEGPEEEISYQRACVGTDDGGVISLDWPENLDLGKEHGLDTTVLIVPGTAEGSMDRYVRSFVSDALQHGYFPIVMNPRGCAGSPLTTPRLFTAADSDDVFRALQFISSVRPWTTVMGVGWGYGANMLTKYLAEVGESTVLTAVVCVDNPFDLAEATRSFPHHIALDQKLMTGLIDILQDNKELFQGKAKNFDVGKALSTKSVRDFDGAISIISHGHDTIEDFYSKTSTRQSIHSLKIPVLFIQACAILMFNSKSDDGTVPTYSIPRSSIAENPFTSLLLCSYLPSSFMATRHSAIFWCQHLAIEWISAVEFTLLKGRHPLLKDADVTINPSKGLAFIDERAPEQNISNGVKGSYNSSPLHLSCKIVDGYINRKLTWPNSVNGFLDDPANSVLKQIDAAAQGKVNGNVDSRSELQQIESGDDDGTKHINAIDFKNSSADTEMDEEENKVLQTAAVVMNMLDVTMPGTLDDEQKKKVLSAVGQGEILVRALQGAVPEDVRGKLTTAVTEIMQTQGKNLNLEGLNRIGWIPNVTSKVKSRIQDTMKISVNKNGHDENNSGVDHEGRVQGDLEQLNSVNISISENVEPSEQRTSQSPGLTDDGCEPSQVNSMERVDHVIDETGGEKHKVSQRLGIADKHIEDDNFLSDASYIHYSEEKSTDHNKEQNMPISMSNSEESLSSSVSVSDHQVVQKECYEFEKNEDKVNQELHQNSHSSTTSNEALHCSSKPPSLSVTQALDALTGFDDSTQMAVNSVFGVLENMIDQLEKSNDEGDDDEVKKSKDEISQILLPDLPTVNGDDYKRTEQRSNRSSKLSNINLSPRHPDNYVNKEDIQADNTVEDKFGSNCLANNLESSTETRTGGSKLNTLGLDPSNNIGKVGPLQNYSLDIAIDPYYWGSPYEAYLQRHISSWFPRPKSSDLDSTTDLFLDPEKGQWKMLDQAGSFSGNIEEGWQNQIINGDTKNQHQSSTQSDADSIIETSYAILDSELPEIEQQLTETFDTKGGWDTKEEEMLCLIRNNLLDSLKVEVDRRLSTPNLKELEGDLVDDMKQVAAAVTKAIVLDNHLDLKSLSEDNHLKMVNGTLDGEHTVKIISSAIEETRYLKKALPVGLIVGSLLASLRKHFKIAALHYVDQNKDIEKSGNIQEKHSMEEVYIRNEHLDDDKNQVYNDLNGVDKNSVTTNYSKDGVMVRAVTAALGATALLAHHQQKDTYKSSQVMEVPSSVTDIKGSQNDEHTKSEEATQEKNPITIVSSLAEKAISVAGPVVPTKDDGEVDQERLVAVLAELGQKGGLLRLVGKVALLWGGLRGAMSLTDRLISFLHIAERPLFQRVIWFGCMVLVLWSPVVIPLLPTIVQSWTTRTSNKIAEYACVLGLHVSSMILVVLWGKRIRGYDNPLERYGLDLTAPRVLGFVKGLIGGMAIVMFVHSINGLLGYASLSWPSGSTLLSLKSFINMLLLGVRGIITATGAALAEELLFRSWLLEEVAVDLGYYRAIMISGVAFSLIHRTQEIGLQNPLWQ
ncbi:Abhydrolase domain containing, partial [Musa troglodytarum]